MLKVFCTPYIFYMVPQFIMSEYLIEFEEIKFPLSKIRENLKKLSKKGHKPAMLQYSLLFSDSSIPK